MTLHLVVHKAAGAAGSDAERAERAALVEAVWEVADSHWGAAAEALLISTDLSPDYLTRHFRTGLARRGFPKAGLLIVVPVTSAAAFSGLPEDAAAWVAEVR
jgi:hypothetical protein